MKEKTLEETRCDQYSLLVISANVGNSLKTIEKVRRNPENTDHHCAYRRAVDSVCDKLKVDTSLLEHASKYYDSHQLKMIKNLENQVQEIKKELNDRLAARTQAFLDKQVELIQENRKLKEEIRAVIMENLDLADGDICTLKRLKDVIGFKLPEDK